MKLDLLILIVDWLINFFLSQCLIPFPLALNTAETQKLEMSIVDIARVRDSQAVPLQLDLLIPWPCMLHSLLFYPVCV